MKLVAFLLIGLSAVLFSACSGKGKKTLVIMSSGKLEIDKNDPSIVNFEPSLQHNEEILAFKGDKAAITVKSPSGSQTYELAEDGIYVLNLKKDTLVGSIVNFGSAGMPTNITGEYLQHIIDSTQQLMMGYNASDENKTYFLAPGTLKKVSANNKANVLGPYNAIPYKVEPGADGNAPEYYKFFTNAQKREALGDLIKRLQR